jgi:hypothetical protein
MKRLFEEVLRRSGRLDTFVDGLVSSRLRGDRPLTPAELLTGITAEVERAITLAPDGPRFPYNRIAIELKAENARRQSELRGALTAAQVTAILVDHLKRRCEVPPDLRVDLHVTADPAATTATYDVEFRSVATRRPAVPAADPPVARLVRGNGARFTLREGIFNVGRVAEAHARDGRLIRLNQIVLDDEDESRTVSRVHARILGTRENDTLTFQVFDDGSRHGSTIVRAGRAHKVHRGSIGMALKDGDELYFGRVRLEFRLRA